jgi:hypothetical protein
MIDQLIDSLVVWEIIGHQKPVDERHIRELPCTVDILSIDRPDLDDTVRVLWRQRERGAVQVNDHP